MEALRLERHEEGAILAVWVLKDQASVVVDAIVAGMLLVIALVHVDVMNSIAGSEFEVFIFLGLRTPLGAKSINDSAMLGDCGDDGVFHGVLQVVVGARSVARH